MKNAPEKNGRQCPLYLFDYLGGCYSKSVRWPHDFAEQQTLKLKFKAVCCNFATAILNYSEVKDHEGPLVGDK